MNTINKIVAKILNKVFRPYFWQLKIEVDIRITNKVTSISIIDGADSKTYQLPLYYSDQPRILAEEVVRMYASDIADQYLKHINLRSAV